MWAPVEGRYGRTRDGRKVGPAMRRNGRYAGIWVWELPGVYIPLYTAEGRYCSDGRDHPLDLVAEWVEEDTWAPVEGRYGRTRDGRKVGPMEPNEARTHPWRVPTGSDPDHKYINWRSDGTGAVFGSVLDPAGPGFDLVAEWVDDGPVRTVTRQEIVPGTYGRLGVGQPYEGVVPVGWIGHHNATYPRLTADELDAAARVLTQLAEALRNG